MSTPAEPTLSAHLKRTHLTSQLGESLNKEVVLAGWVHEVRVLGGISFLLLRDMSGIVQVTAPKAKAPAEVLKEIASLHQEDVLFVRGMVVASKIAKRGIEVIPSELEVVSRAETPLPLDPRGVQNTLLETRLNWRGLEFRSEESDADVMKVLEEFMDHCVKTVREACGEELKRLGQELELLGLPLKRIQYSEAVNMLRKSGEEIEYGMDFSKTQERKLAGLVGKNAFFMVDWPLELKAFYAMPNPDGKTCRAFDMIYNGLEVSSGTQRIHLPNLLINRLKAKGLNPDNFKSYVDAFRYGAPYHAGWSIGLERLTMKITGRDNIREATMFPRDRNRITP